MTEPNKPNKKVKISYEACMKAYKYILPEIIELAKKESLEKNKVN